MLYLVKQTSNYQKACKFCRDKETNLQLLEPLIASVLRNWDYTKFDESIMNGSFYNDHIHAEYVY